MIKLLTIRNFALAEDLRIEFAQGLNILTGETGAGKSILVGAVAAVLGGRVYTDVIRSGFDRAVVEMIVDMESVPGIRTLLEERGVPTGEELLLRREISTKGASRAFVNDTALTIGSLAEIGDMLVDIHGQHEHQRLLRRETHIGFLDALGKHDPLLEDVAEAFAAADAAGRAVVELERRDEELREKHDLREFQFNEIERAQLRPGEDEELLREASLLNNMEKLTVVAARLEELFNEDSQGLLTLIADADHGLQELTAYSTELEKLYGEFRGARIVLQEIAGSLESFRSGLEFDAQRLEESEGRLDLIARLKKKYGGSIEEILSLRDELRGLLRMRENFADELVRLKELHSKARAAYATAALKLSKARMATAKKMAEGVEQQLVSLGIPGMRFEVRIEREGDPGGMYEDDGGRFAGDASGIDVVEFFISPNTGEEFKPLNKIASGGEISRIMLALKTILTEVDPVPTLVFDEIDAGVSGRIAQAVGRKIYQLSQGRQILCITHLPQIASQGDAHFAVEKYVDNQRTFTRITSLGEKERVEAIARLMAGEKVTDTVRQTARQLIDEVRR